jgi:hypothetical protein
MDDPAIVQPRPSYEVVFDPEGLWIAPQVWKTPREGSDQSVPRSRRFPHLLGRATPAHTIHRPDYDSLSNHKTD